jgi:hypothetical protein
MTRSRHSASQFAGAEPALSSQAATSQAADGKINRKLFLMFIAASALTWAAFMAIHGLK